MPKPPNVARRLRLLIIIAGLCAAVLASPFPALAGRFGCSGDCGGDGTVSVDEVLVGINIAHGIEQLTACASMDPSGDLTVSVDELLLAVHDLIVGCPPVAPTATPTGNATAVTPTFTPPPLPTDATMSPAVTATPTATPVGAPTGLTAQIEGDLVVLGWTNADPASGYTEARVLRRLNAPVDGPEDPEAVEIYFGADAEAGDPVTGLLPSVDQEAQTYHYAVYGCAAPTVCETTGSAATVSPTVIEALRAGGYVIAWRHADADVCADQISLGPASNPAVPDWWKSCDSNCSTATARQLSDAGRAHATAIGEAFDSRGIPVGRVITSEFCRNFQTAELFDFGPAYELDQDITFFVYEEANRCASSFALVTAPPAPGTNTAVIGHAGFPSSCAIFGSLQWSQAAIFKPDGQGGQTLILLVTWDQWPTLP